MKKFGERNIIKNVVISKARIVGAKNLIDNEADEFTVAIEASATDSTLFDGKETNIKQDSYLEFWTFEWEQSDWVLKKVASDKSILFVVNSKIIHEQSVRRRKVS